MYARRRIGKSNDVLMNNYRLHDLSGKSLAAPFPRQFFFYMMLLQ